MAPGVSAAAAATRSLKIFVGNVPWTVGHRELRNYFAQFGRVTWAQVIFDRRTGLSKGYGFVSFQKAAALENLQQTQKHVIEQSSIFYQLSD
ncbi:SRA stem-loop-interacting RNA-binding protein, mitochondrial [Malaya genurostris]|uniref:SRA stem-loop-interacting RNA-binding protein, mitochondrial n=1 Tax=Malaya genurostris TaxID=325434 RepID=UPI0026F3C205|nr:SRA stem-loop-interacting RNA-binding protein, mitochondrial [Malaya genurostris]XP_058444306.1 SRA stem-loop-interacting RNA-binding protein, mitochondrial [Malaya genurostris]XP_058444309.1 SRA stem-loop-interacting RNA-binding protein, mitochondrial [Malaya genurostris]